MLNINIFDDFISVGAREGISKYASAIMDEDFSDGMTGYDIEQLVKVVLSKNQMYANIMEHFSFDSEYSMFCMYYKHHGKGLAVKQKTTDEAIKKCMEYVIILNSLIRNEYINSVMAHDFNIKPEIHDTRKLALTPSFQ